MALNQEQIVDAAHAMLREDGLAGLSMRRLASKLGVQAGALYHHVASKQELLAAVAERILADVAPVTPGTDPARAASALREALLRVRDSAEIVSFVYAYKPAVLVPLRALRPLLAAALPEEKAHRAEQAASVLISYVLGFVAAEQNEAELVRAKLARGRPTAAVSEETFRFGVELILRGLAGPTSAPPKRPRR